MRIPPSSLGTTPPSSALGKFQPSSTRLLNSQAVFTHPKGISELKLGHHLQENATAKLVFLPQTGLNEARSQEHCPSLAW